MPFPQFLLRYPRSVTTSPLFFIINMILSVSNQKYDAYSFNQLHLGQQLEIADEIAGL